MIPTGQQVYTVWEKYAVPRQKRTHLALVARVSLFLANQMIEASKTTGRPVVINTLLLETSALLHDIDKAAPKLPNEQHPDAAVRILKEEGMGELADIVATHPLHAILNPTTAPKTMEQKLLYLADKMVKYEVIDVDRRIALWRAEDLSPEERRELEDAYPKVKALEKEVFDCLNIEPQDVAKFIQ